MAKLSRKDRYKDLRDSIQLDQGEQFVQPKIDQNADLDFNNKSAAQQHVLPQTRSVMSDLLDEVSVYNQNSSMAHLEDKQIEILNEISNSSHDLDRRNSHLMTMEQKQDDGGTTRNLFSSDLSSVAQNTNVKVQTQTNQEQKIDLFADMPVRTATNPAPVKTSRSAQFREILETDDLLNQKLNLPSQEDKKKIQQEAPKQKLSRTKSPEDLAQEQYFASKKPRRQSHQIVHDSSLDKPASKAALVFMILCCVILSVLIGLTIFWMSKLRIF